MSAAPQPYVVTAEQMSRHQIFPGVEIATMAGTNMMISVVTFEPHAVVELHSHPHEQMGILLEGELTFHIGEEVFQVQPGQGWRIPGDVEHKAIAGDSPVRAIDIFHPIREDYR